MYKLDILAKNTENIEIYITLDGIKLTKRLFHIIVGLKIVDVHARYPKLVTLLLSTDIETSGISSIQIHNNSYVVEMHLMKDTKDRYKNFTDFFQFYSKIREEGLYTYEYGHIIKKLKVINPQDLKSN